MATKTSYSHARENLASLWDEVEDSREAAVIQRRGHEDMALIPADELSSLRETAYLLRSPENAVRLLAALTRARRGKKKPTDLAALRKTLEAL
ncbi:MAG: type II toxin-antitoxin system prevent-host-death family antitoxin [Gemmatimonadaceae bacterium]